MLSLNVDGETRVDCATLLIESYVDYPGSPERHRAFRARLIAL